MSEKRAMIAAMLGAAVHIALKGNAVVSHADTRQPHVIGVVFFLGNCRGLVELDTTELTLNDYNPAKIAELISVRVDNAEVEMRRLEKAAGKAGAT